MNQPKHLKTLAGGHWIWLAAALVIGGMAFTLFAAEPADSAAAPAASQSPTNAPEARSAAVKAQISGAELYSMHCNRCHPERYPTERTGAQWKTIMLHMQVRANIPVSQARQILKYLQDNSGR